MTKINLEQIKTDLLNIRDLNGLTTEFTKIKKEISKINLKKEITQKSKKRLKILEKKYASLKIKTIKVQKQADKEIDKVLTLIKKTKNEARKSFNNIAKTVIGEQKRLSKVMTKTPVKRKTRTKKVSVKKN